jgi:hypothetical protein
MPTLDFTVVVGGLLSREINLTSGCRWESKPANFSPMWSASPQERQVKNEEIGFMRWSLVCPNKKQLVARDKISIYIHIMQ